MRFQLLIFFTFLFTFSNQSFAQEKNQFLDRAFWKKQPSLSELKSVISSQNDLTAFDKNLFDPMVFAIIEKNSMENLLFLLEQKGNEVNKITHDKRTYLFWAAYAGNLPLMEYLVKNGAKTDLLDEHENTVMLFAASNGLTDLAIYDFLIKHGANVVSEKTTTGANVLLCVAPYLNDLTIVDYFTKKGIDIKSTDDNGNGIFNHAARNGNQDFLLKLISLGLLPKTLNSEGGNAFYFACLGSRAKTNTLEFYKFLDAQGIKANFVTKDGTNALHLLAGKTKDKEIIAFFLEKKVDVNQKDKDGNSPIFIAASRQSNLEIIKLLSDESANLLTTNKDRKTVHMLALENNTSEIFDYFCSKQAPKIQFDINGNGFGYYLCHSFSLANKENFERNIAILKKYTIDFLSIQQNGNNIFHNCAEINNLDLLNEISALTKENINAINLDGLAPIHIAAMKATNTEFLKRLIELGAEVYIETEFGETPFDIASENELLKAQHIDLNFLN